MQYETNVLIYITAKALCSLLLFTYKVGEKLTVMSLKNAVPSKFNYGK